MRFRFRFPLAAALSLLAVTASAQGASPASSRPIRLGLAGGLTVPRTGASASTLRSGAHAQGFALVRLGPLPPLRLNVDYSRLRIERPAMATGANAEALDADRSILAGVASLQLDLLHGPVRPYLLAGAGAFSVRDLVETQAQGTSFRSTNLGLDGGAGLALRLGPIDAFVESRLQNVYTSRGGLIDTRAIRAIPVAFGIVL